MEGNREKEADESHPLLADDLRDKNNSTFDPEDPEIDEDKRLLTDHLRRHFARDFSDESMNTTKSNKVVTTDTMMYDTSTLVTWEAFSMGSNSVWKSWELWSMMLRLGAVCLVVAILTVLLVRDPAALRLSKFTEVSKFLNVLVGLLLGFFLSSSMTRWHECIDGFMGLLDAIRNLQMQLAALGVEREESTLVVRYGLASAWLLYGSLMIQWKTIAGVNKKEAAGEMWKLIHEKLVNLDGTGDVPLLQTEEIEVVKPTRDPSGMMWMWMGALIGKLAQEGFIPGMATPTYGRIMNLCQDGHGGIRDVRASITVQAPLPYTHTLSILVHINGLLNALTMGLVCGVGLGTFLVRHKIHIYENKATGNEAAQDVQGMLVTFLYTFFVPLLYQALLLISMHIAQPFDNEDTSMPLDRLLHSLEHDVKNGTELWLQLPEEERPCFKQKA
jgi:predicted membrane chloride channel (bestrophin family)